MSKLVTELSIGSLPGACAVFDRMAQDIIHLAHEDAKLEAAIADLKALHEKATAEDRAGIALAAERLTSYIATHPASFEDPRKVKTSFGSFGLRHISSLEITDERRLISWLVNSGVAGCLKTTVKPDKTAIRKLIDAGTIKTPSGAEIQEADAPVYEVDKSLIERARKTGLSH